MPTPQEHAGFDYENLALEVSGFYDRLCAARDEGDTEHATAMEAEMNQSLEELQDVIRAIGHTAL